MKKKIFRYKLNENPRHKQIYNNRQEPHCKENTKIGPKSFAMTESPFANPKQLKR